MVNLDKWEEINYEDVRVGDKLRVITQQGNVTNDTKGIAHSYVTYHGWRSVDGVTFLSSAGRFNPIPGGSRTIYRRKTKEKPFVFPENFGEIISVTGRVSGRRYNFINIGRGRYLRDDSLASHGKDRLVDNYKDFKLEREGLIK